MIVPSPTCGILKLVKPETGNDASGLVDPLRMVRDGLIQREFFLDTRPKAALKIVIEESCDSTGSSSAIFRGSGTGA